LNYHPREEYALVDHVSLTLKPPQPCSLSLIGRRSEIS